MHRVVLSLLKKNNALNNFIVEYQILRSHKIENTMLDNKNNKEANISIIEQLSNSF